MEEEEDYICGDLPHPSADELQMTTRTTMLIVDFLMNYNVLTTQ